jgi:hypothetical protein
MFDALFTSNTPLSLSPRFTLAALLLHLILLVITIEQTTARPHTVHPRAWVPPAPAALPQVPDLPYMPTVDAAGLIRHPLHITALVGMAPTDMLLRAEAGYYRRGEVGVRYRHRPGRHRLGPGDRQHRRRVTSVEY